MGAVTLNYPRKVGYSQRQYTQSCYIVQRHRISNTEVKQKVLGPRNTSVTEQLYNHRLRWLGHVLRM